MGALLAKIAVSSATFAIDRPYTYIIPEHLAANAVVGCRVMVPFGRGNRRCEGVILEIGEGEITHNLKPVDTVLDNEPVLMREQIKLAIWLSGRCFCTVYDVLKAMLPSGLWYKLKEKYRLKPDISREEAYAKTEKSRTSTEILDAVYANGGKLDKQVLNSIFAEKDITQQLKKMCDDGILEAEQIEVRGIKDKTINEAVLVIPAEDAAELARQKKKAASVQSAILELLAVMGCAPVKEILYFTGASPASIKSLERAGVIEINKREVLRRPDIATEERRSSPVLNDEQSKAFSEIKALIDTGPKAALLYGITGSGKTSVYIKLIEEVIARNKTAIVLVPEIALTPQLMSTFTSHFGDSTALLHSALSTGERYDEWKRIRSGSVKVVVGTRSAVFAPVKNLGIIIIDEEQEHTYKSENNPRYHARDAAKFRCVQNNALLLLGSATPSIDSMYNAKLGKYSLVSMRSRYNNHALPSVMIVDMKKELKNGNGGAISSVLRDEISKNLDSGEQSILFINRRGASTVIACGECGYTFTCPRCSVSLTYHSANRRLMCHYCGYSEPERETCPECGGLLKYIGVGTQKVEEELKELFPGEEIMRMDMDTVSPANPHEKLFSKFEKKNIPILVGTQMVAKGLNFDNVTLVGVISADQSLYINDYHAQERTFSLITQVVGRAGRGHKLGRAVIQTLTPGNDVINYAANQNYDDFYRQEIEVRKVIGCPPITDIFTITVSSAEESKVLECSCVIRDILKKELKYTENVNVLGPAPAAVVKVNNRYRYKVSVKGKDCKKLRELISGVLKFISKEKKFKGVSVFADMNPID